MQTIQQTIELLHASLRDYIEATYHISSPALIQLRRKLLNAPGAIHQVPYLESTPRYVTGERLENIPGLPPAALAAFESLSVPTKNLPRIIYNPLYKHQSDSIQSIFNDRNVVLMTGTGSGKTEAFLLPILGKLAREAERSPTSFASPAMRALILYPMNALVNDQLGRLRGIFGDPRIVELFMKFAGRPPRFARYTSRTPYAGIRSSAKDSTKLKAFGDFYASLEALSLASGSGKSLRASEIISTLKQKGKWPAKPSILDWYGTKGSRWQNDASGLFERAVTLSLDSELLTRHEVQENPPDLLVTNYSMLEYMLMRPIERSIFDSARRWLDQNADEKFLVVLDEAHLYRGAAGAEVGLLLRRLRDRLNIPPERFQVICATASFNEDGDPKGFGAQLSGNSENSFDVVKGALNLSSHAAVGTDHDAEILNSVDIRKFYETTNDADRLDIVATLLAHRNTDRTGTAEKSLHSALKEFGPLGLLVNKSMVAACPIASLGLEIFPSVQEAAANSALTVLASLGSMARESETTPGLLPCRIHNFFRGLPGLWVCMDPNCSMIQSADRNDICGQMYSQPREMCECGSRILELFTCRSCGTAYARAYTDNIDSPSHLWSAPGKRLRMQSDEHAPLLALDLLLESPSDQQLAEPADFDLETGQLNPANLGSRTRRVFLRAPSVIEDDDEDGQDVESEDRGKFIPCAVCNQKSRANRSYVQDHQTKGDQPFQALVARQLQIQLPSVMQATAFAPLQGRKVLTFSDSRQVAARLAPNLQMYSVRDSLRPLIIYGFRKLQSIGSVAGNLSLEDVYLAVLLASKELNVRLRPELKDGEDFYNADRAVTEAVKNGDTLTEAGLLRLFIDLRNERVPQSLLDNIVTTIGDRFLGLEALALSSIAERARHTSFIEALPNIEGVAENPTTKLQLARTWLRCWTSKGFWLNSMPVDWYKRPKSVGVRVDSHKGKFKAMDRVLLDRASRQRFTKDWLPALLARLTTDMGGGARRLSGAELSLDLGGRWVHCSRCKSVHRPIDSVGHCLDCCYEDIREIDPNTDTVFRARKGFYRQPVMESLEYPPRQPMALVAAEHTAQLNAPQNEDVFSKAEENELLFQDINLDVDGDARLTAIDVLSSTTTMEVGIDIGALSGVALRNMPPARSNYQQRAGRAGRRGNSIATVIAFGSADSHDAHYFRSPQSIIRGPVIDPQLTLDNVEIVRRHIRAFLLQTYHQARILRVDNGQSSDLFSVLGSVTNFRRPESVLNRTDFERWLRANENDLVERVLSWIPSELSQSHREELVQSMIDDCLEAIDQAIPVSEGSNTGTAGRSAEDGEFEAPSEEGDVVPSSVARQSTLLDRLLYCGKLPRYAFPTDVATFHVFDQERSSTFRPVMKFAPSQGLPIALSQYAPDKHVWIAGKCYTSSAIYSVMPDDRFVAWDERRIYMECRDCGSADTFSLDQLSRGDSEDCRACGGERTFGPGRIWLRPTGFAHPVDTPVVTSPDDIPETSYATRAKLTTATQNSAEWIVVSDRIKALRTRPHLLVSNTGPKGEGYTYCTKCGRIESAVNASALLTGPHPKPFPEEEDRRICSGDRTARHIVLGTDFITDVVLFSLSVEAPLRLKPADSATNVALRTISEALAIAACEMFEIEPSELMAEFRPALSPAGANGLEAEVFLYDTLPGGAGFATQLADRGLELFQNALDLLKGCPSNCDVSCYNCLRSFKNKFEHSLLDRHVGAELLEFLLHGQIKFDQSRIDSATSLLFNDLCRQNTGNVEFQRSVDVSTSGSVLHAPILAQSSDGSRRIICLSGALCAGHPADAELAAYQRTAGTVPVFVENELLVRSNIAAATTRLLETLSSVRN